MKVAMDLYFHDEFRKALATRLGNEGGIATRNDIRRWATAILKFASDDVLSHPKAEPAEPKMEIVVTPPLPPDAELSSAEGAGDV